MTVFNSRFMPCPNPEGGGGRGVQTLLKNHKNIGFLSNICWDPLNFTKLNVGPSLARQRNTI